MRFNFLASVSALVLAALLPHQALAGFEFVPPAPQAAPMPTTEMTAVPATPVASAPLPAIVKPAAPMYAPAPVMPAPVSNLPPNAETAPMNLTPSSPMKTTAKAPTKTPTPETASANVTDKQIPVYEPGPEIVTEDAAQNEQPTASATSENTSSGDVDSGPVVQGFGKAMPLALALQQIVPSNYRYSFDGGINPGMRVSWTGGKPWKEVIATIARDNNMNVDIVSNVVAFRNPSAMIPPVATTVSLAPSVNNIPAAAPTASLSTPTPTSPTTAKNNYITGGLLSGENDEMENVPVGEPTPLVPVESAPKAAPVMPSEPVIAKAPAIAQEDKAPAPPVAKPATDATLPTRQPLASISDSLFDAPAAASALNAPSTVNAAPPIEDSMMPVPLLPKTPAKDMSKDAVTENKPAAPVASKPVESNIASKEKTKEPAKETPKENSAAESEGKSAFFDSMFDAETPAAPAVPNKDILTDSDSQKKNPSELTPVTTEELKPIAPAVKKPETVAEKADPLNSIDKGNMDAAPGIIRSAQKTPAEQSLPVTTPMPAKPMSMPAPMALAAASASPLAATSKGGDMVSVQEWVAHKNDTLRQTLTQWSEQAGVSMVWSSEYDYPLQTDVHVTSGYSDAVRTLLAGFSKAQPRPLGRLFKNDKVGAQPVLIVETQRLTN